MDSTKQARWRRRLCNWRRLWPALGVVALTGCGATVTPEAGAPLSSSTYTSVQATATLAPVTLTPQPTPTLGLEATERAVLYFLESGTWTVCAEIRPAVRRLQKEFAGRVDVVSVNPRSARGRKLAGTYGMAFTPTFVFSRADGTVHTMFIGEVDEERLRQELDVLAGLPN